VADITMDHDRHGHSLMAGRAKNFCAGKAMIAACRAGTPVLLPW
jgi:hypothetical protein